MAVPSRIKISSPPSRHRIAIFRQLARRLMRDVVLCRQAPKHMEMASTRSVAEYGLSNGLAITSRCGSLRMEVSPRICSQTLPTQHPMLLHGAHRKRGLKVLVILTTTSPTTISYSILHSVGTGLGMTMYGGILGPAPRQRVL
jgi:hypothetical protein